MIYDYEMDMSKSLTKGISSTVIIAIKQSKFPIKLPTRIQFADPKGGYSKHRTTCGKNAILVGGIPTPLKNMNVSWDDDIPNIWEVIKFHGSSHHQPAISVCLCGN